MNEKLQVLESEIDRRLQVLNLLLTTKFGCLEEALAQIKAINNALEEIKKLR